MSNADLYEQAIEYYSNLMRSSPRECFLDLWKAGYTWKGRAVFVPLKIWGEMTTARGKGASKPVPTAKGNWSTTFVDIPLTGHAWEEIDEWGGTPDSIFDHATALMEDGYRLGFSYNNQNGAFICSVTCKDDESVNKGKTFTAFAGSWFEALQAALYKHYVVAGQNWGGGVAKGNTPAFG